MTACYGGADPCGAMDDTDVLWQKAHGCYLNPTPKTKACPAEDIDPSPKPVWVVTNGGDHDPNRPNTQDFLLVPTDRIKGIECPKIWQPNAPDYWSTAWARSQNLVRPTQNLRRALGINSIHGRQQLHIHTTALRPEALIDLEDKDKTILSVKPETWKASGLKYVGGTRKQK